MLDMVQQEITKTTAISDVVRVHATRKNRKGKTVTIISGIKGVLAHRLPFVEMNVRFPNKLDHHGLQAVHIICLKKLVAIDSQEAILERECRGGSHSMIDGFDHIMTCTVFEILSFCPIPCSDAMSRLVREPGVYNHLDYMLLCRVIVLLNWLPL